jgi:lipoprotein-anchoring transpeptidase ErfK/SrfK
MKTRVSVFICLLAILCFVNMGSIAQSAVQGHENAPIKDAKIISEETDAQGRTVRIVQYSRGNIKITETIFIKKEPALKGYKVPINPDTLVKTQLEIIVNKSSYRVGLYYRKKLIRSYRAVFGPNPSMNKVMEGDRNTPEGHFTISRKNPNSKYTKFLGISYPNDSSYHRFNTLKANGKIPANAKIGGDVGIHGVWTGGDDMIEMGIGWTDGCVAIRNKDIEELFSLVGVGTKVIIRK